MLSNWLITGGCGFIGVNLVKALKKQDAYVRILDNLSIGKRDDLKAVTDFEETPAAAEPERGRVDLIIGDMHEARDLNGALKDIDVVVHLAAQTSVMDSIEDPKFDCVQNVLGTLSVLQAVRSAGVKKLIYASSAEPLGNQEPPTKEDAATRPTSPYGAAKLSGEAYCLAFFGSYGINSVVLRFSNIYGPYLQNKTSVIPVCFKRAVAGEPLIIRGDGAQTRDFIHTDDVCLAIINAANAEMGGEIIQIASGVETSIGMLVQRIAAMVERDTSRKVTIERLPARPGEILRSFADISKAKNILGYELSINLEEGLESTWRWFKERMSKE